MVGTYTYHSALRYYLWLGNSTPVSSSGGTLFTTQSNRGYLEFFSLVILRLYIHENRESVFSKELVTFLFFYDNLNLLVGAV